MGCFLLVIAPKAKVTDSIICLMIKASVHGHGADSGQKENIKALFDALWPNVIVDTQIVLPQNHRLH